jgi:hypothetical protein
LARHRAEIEAKINEGVALSLRAARRLISAPQSTVDSQAPGPEPSSAEEETLAARWHRLPKEERAAFLDAIGVDEILKNMSPAFGTELRSRVPKPKKRKNLTLTANPDPAQQRESRIRH